MSFVIWRFSDGKAGHDRQSSGLVNALAERVPVEVHVIPVKRDYSLPWRWLLGRYPAGNSLPAPDLLMGAGHATHLHLLAARRARGGRSIVLMKPSLPCAWFDLCLVPEHDRPAAGENLVVTQGVLNSIRAGDRQSGDTGLIMIGGPSRHFHWDDSDILRQLDELLRLRPRRCWWLGSSRRTPAALADKLRALPGVEYRAFDETTADWWPERLAEAGEVWVTQDSVSMIYESLSSGAKVGLLEVRPAGRNRLTRGVDKLVSDGWVARPRQWRLAAGPQQTLDEAARCADWITRQWLSVP